MINEFEYYHGVALRSIIANSPEGITIEAKDLSGRINSYIINNSVGVHIKHSTKRLSPWQFSFSIQNLQEILEVRREARSMWLVLICGPDGVVAISLEDFASITESRPGGVAPIRIDRGPDKMYRVSGNAGALPFRKARGVMPIVADAFPGAEESFSESNLSNHGLESKSAHPVSDSKSREVALKLCTSFLQFGIPGGSS